MYVFPVMSVPADEVKVDMKLSTLKQKIARWLLKAWDYTNGKEGLLQKGRDKTGFSKAWETDTQLRAFQGFVGREAVQGDGGRDS